MMIEDIPYDPSEVVEGIADIMSQSNQSYDFDFEDYAPQPPRKPIA